MIYSYRIVDTLTHRLCGRRDTGHMTGTTGYFSRPDIPCLDHQYGYCEVNVSICDMIIFVHRLVKFFLDCTQRTDICIEGNNAITLIHKYTTQKMYWECLISMTSKVSQNLQGEVFFTITQAMHCTHTWKDQGCVQKTYKGSPLANEIRKVLVMTNERKKLNVQPIV